MKNSDFEVNGNLTFIGFLDAMLNTGYYGSSYVHKVKFDFMAFLCMKDLYECIYVMLNPYSNGVTINSGYRDLVTNQYVKGRSNSQHMYGEAFDFKCNDMPRVFNFIKEHLVFDQLIWEYGTKACPQWIHVSYSKRRGNRKQVIYNYK